jgi:hypothetical protein
VLLSLCYLVLRGVLRLTTLRCRSKDFKELEILVVRHELMRVCLAVLARARNRPDFMWDFVVEAAGSRRSPD